MSELIPFEIQIKLQKNWGALAETMECFCECRLFDENTKWEWFIYAQNPENVDELLAIENTNVVNPACFLSYKMLGEIFNCDGENILFDISYRKKTAKIQFNTIRENNKWKLIDIQSDH